MPIKFFCATIISLSLGSAMISNSVFSMEMENVQAICQQKSTLSAQTQRNLAAYGADLLDQISSGGLSKEELKTQDIYGKFKEILGDKYDCSLYAPISSFLAPSSFVRWALASSDLSYNTVRKNHLAAIILISWALLDKAKNQGDYFERGSWSIVDPDHRLYTFLLDYVKLTTGSDDPKSLPFVMTKSNFAYRRDPQLYASTHHGDHCLDSQFGIDVRFEPQDGVRKLFPFDFTHLLFAKLSLGGEQHEPLLFVKLEDIGMGSIGATVAHLSSFGKSTGNVDCNTRREKDIPNGIKEAINSFKQETGLTEDFKKIRNAYLVAKKIMVATQVGKEAFEEEQELFNNSIFMECLEKGSGILADLYSEDVAHKNDADLYGKAKKFLDTVDAFYPNGNNELRIGNEVILDLGPIKK